MMNRILILLIVPLFFSSFNMNELKKEPLNDRFMKTQKNGGIIFFSTLKLEEVSQFYIQKVGCKLWLDQGACKILKHGNMLIGFCQGNEVDTQGVITFFYPEKDSVDRMYKKLKDVAKNPPKMNPKFNIYHFYGEDPEGRSIEFQFFNHELKEY